MFQSNKINCIEVEMEYKINEIKKVLNWNLSLDVI